MNRILKVLLLSFLFSSATQAQNVDYRKEIQEVVKRIDSINEDIDKTDKDINSKKDSIAKMNRDILNFQQPAKVEIDPTLINLCQEYIDFVSEIIYTPYNEYIINEIALPAFDLVSGELSEKNEKCRLLLQNYKKDITSMIAFLSTAETDPTKAKATIKTQQFYKNYSAYEDWQNTYLGKIIVTTENILNSSEPDKNAQLRTLKNRLSKLLN